MTVVNLAYIPSPPQGVWHLGPIPIRAYALCIIAGIIVALVIGDRRWEQRGGERGVIYDIALWAVPFGLVGGRLYHVMTDWQTYFGPHGKGLGKAIAVWEGGLGIWGAVALGGVGAWIACRRRGISLPAFGDAIAPGIVLAQAIGRLGNYFNQELTGGPTTLPWGLELFYRRSADGTVDVLNLNGVSTGEVAQVVHPTFLYELLWNVLVFALLIFVDRRFKIGHGRLFAMYVAAYCVGRFWVELMRVDPATQFGGIRVNSFTSTLVFLGAIAYILLAPKGREDPATLGGTPAQTEEAASADGEAAAQEPADSTDVADAGEEDVTKAPVDDPAEESADETGENSGIVEK
ncbi:prolipoprotein diacylglyceryl transferase [Mycobacteroides chelonae]|nr:prolipoprotein diacylglyceryl transferase [Mycobacteroides chelonae]AMW20149.1 prolipoprotein diacylglyceryl transferase [Mycobacterium sp. QIA-37]MBV0916573.1 prolipoprotein diacylglyceryl transferase [Mycobacteroides chelonae]GLE58146.1 prolipoprotein diacylglyceryl transferase [Mycobacteroides chelonae]